MPKKIRDSVVVITGASSGIGRATALACARRGAAVVIAARREGLLEDVAGECERLGGRALAVPTDVTDEQAVKELARQAVQNFGRLDVWVNNAGVTLFSRFEEAPIEEYRRVFETNLFGYVYGARAALPYFREQGSGVLINNDSVVAKASQPYTSAYVTSKFAVRGLSECLREELILDGAKDIHVCTIMPASIDTPFFQHGANYTGRAPKALNPVYDAEKVAKAIIRCAQRPKREVIVGNAGRLLALQHTLSLGFYENMAARQIDKDHFQDEPASSTSGNLFEPLQEGTEVSGSWKNADGTVSARRMALAGALAAAAGAGLLSWRWLRRN
jgi:NAD(P)-dependent dehydrogenase (short-subunit alcohol dehydrogenase family)